MGLLIYYMYVDILYVKSLLIFRTEDRKVHRLKGIKKKKKLITMSSACFPVWPKPQAFISGKSNREE